MQHSNMYHIGEQWFESLLLIQLPANASEAAGACLNLLELLPSKREIGMEL